MWINVEVWDKIAKDSLQNFRKGASLNGLGTLIFNRWTDKASGEERKQFKYRLQKLMTADEMALFNDSDLTVIDESNISSGTARIVSDVSQTSGELRTLQTQRIDDKAKLVLSKAVIEEVPVSSQALVNTDPTSIASANLITERIASRSYDRNLQTNSPITDKRSQQSVDRQMPNQGPTAPSGRSRITYGAYDPDME